MKNFKNLIFIIIVLLFPGRGDSANIVSYNIDGHSVEAAEGEILVRFRPGARPSSVAALNSRTGGSRVSEIKAIGVEKIKVPAGENFEDILNEYRQDESVEFAYPNIVYGISSYRLPDQYPTITEMEDSQWGLEKIDAHYAWSSETGSREVIVAVADTGVDYNHPDLADNMWEDPGTGFPGKNFTGGTDDPMDDHDTADGNSHGTHVAGIIGGSSKASGIAGVSWRSRIMAVKVMGSDGRGYDFHIGEGIIYAADNGVDIINLSLGTDGYSPIMTAAVDYAYQQGSFIVAAAGNEGAASISYPAALDNVLAVGASEKSDDKAGFSNFGEGLDIVAPGVDIKSTIKLSKGTHGNMSGTSMAAPFASGVAALIISHFKGMGATYRLKDLRTIINSSADRNDSRQWDSFTGYGRLNARQALNIADSYAIDIEIIAFPNPFDPGLDGNVMLKLGTNGDEEFRFIKIYSLDGQLVREIERPSGTIVPWNGRNNDNSPVAPGLYFMWAEMENGDNVRGKITVLRR